MRQPRLDGGLAAWLALRRQFRELGRRYPSLTSPESRRRLQDYTDSMDVEPEASDDEPGPIEEK
ncbi:MAG: hypothetical protein WDA71_12065 [Actinomycetota bacterium]